LDVYLSQTSADIRDDDLSVLYHYRRTLPHHQWWGKTFFITFCTYQRFNLSPGSRDIVVGTCKAGDGELFLLHALVVMPDHVHLALTPLNNKNGAVPIPKIMQAIKGASAHRINKYLGSKGRVWQDESFDRAARSAENLGAKIEYMMGNPVRAGLVRDPFEYRWLWIESRARTPAPHNRSYLVPDSSN
jgi:REP element-mobilizing transposase RayT